MQSNNVCNASSVSKLINPLKFSKNFSQLVRPSAVSTPVISNSVCNVCNVRNVNSISQLVKTINVTESVCSSNASNSVICNSTCKPVSNFVNYCQSVKPACKLIIKNRKTSS